MCSVAKLNLDNLSGRVPITLCSLSQWDPVKSRSSRHVGSRLEAHCTFYLLIKRRHTQSNAVASVTLQMIHLYSSELQ